MDDFIKSVKTDDEAKEVFANVTECLKLSGFELKKWISNSEALMEKIPVDLQSDAKSKTFELEPLNSSILGLKWNVESDTLEVSRGPQKPLPVTVTQRAVLSHVSSVFDPLGLFAPFTMRMRMLLKTVWKQIGQDWDRPLAAEEIKIFDEWAEELKVIKEFTIQRRYFKAEETT